MRCAPSGFRCHRLCKELTGEGVLPSSKSSVTGVGRGGCDGDDGVTFASATDHRLAHKSHTVGVQICTTCTDEIKTESRRRPRQTDTGRGRVGPQQRTAGSLIEQISQRGLVELWRITKHGQQTTMKGDDDDEDGSGGHMSHAGARHGMAPKASPDLFWGLPRESRQGTLHQLQDSSFSRSVLFAFSYERIEKTTKHLPWRQEHPGCPEEF